MHELEANVTIGPFSPQLRDKNAHFPWGININAFIILSLTGFDKMSRLDTAISQGVLDFR
jgi:hypothetical protein